MSRRRCGAGGTPSPPKRGSQRKRGGKGGKGAGKRAAQVAPVGKREARRVRQLEEEAASVAAAAGRPRKKGTRPTLLVAQSYRPPPARAQFPFPLCAHPQQQQQQKQQPSRSPRVRSHAGAESLFEAEPAGERLAMAMPLTMDLPSRRARDLLFESMDGCVQLPYRHRRLEGGVLSDRRYGYRRCG